MRLKKTGHLLFLLKSVALLLLLPAVPAVFFNSACSPKQELKSVVADTLEPDSSQITILSQNTMLIPFGIAAPDYVKRTGILAEVLSAGEFDIVGLQEVFADKSQNCILEAWHRKIISGSEGIWQPISSAKEVSELTAAKNRFDIKIIDARPNEKSAKISFGPYYVLGPDAGDCNIFKQDSGLLILSRFPIIAASAFSFSDARGSDRLANKGVVYARIKMGPANDDYIHFFSTHFQSHGYSETRFKNLKELLRFVSNIIVDDLGGMQASGIHPIIMVGDFNIKAGMPDGWIKKAGIISAPMGHKMPDDANTALNTSADYIEFMKYLQSFSESFILEHSDEFISEDGAQKDLLYFKDLWQDLYPDDPGFTWIGKNWKTGVQNPYGADGNLYAVESGPPERIDYVVFYKGTNTLQLNPTSINLFSNDSSGLQVSDHLGLVSDFDRQN